VADDAGGDAALMRICLAEAAAAARAGEVPIGAVVARDGAVVATGRNSAIRLDDPSAHAEIVALRAAARREGNYRLAGAELFVTVEPCLMCVGAILQARLRRVVFGCADPKAGALGSIADFSHDRRLNHRFAVERGVCEKQARELLQDFFRQRRR